MMKYNYINESMDFEILKENLDELTLQMIDDDIKEHFDTCIENESFEEERKDSVCWWFGSIDTKDLIDYYRG